MLHEINANAALPTGPIQLRADSLGLGTVDGGSGFALTLKLVSGDPVIVVTTLGRAEPEVTGTRPTEDDDTPKGATKDTPKNVTELLLGQTTVIKTRATFRTAGISSWIQIGRHSDDASLRTQRLGSAA